MAESNFKPDQYMSRAEFATAMVQIAREVPADPATYGKNQSGLIYKRHQKTRGSIAI